MLREYLKSIADKLREKLGISESINARSFIDKIDNVYDAGADKATVEFWNGITNNGQRSNYMRFFNESNSDLNSIPPGLIKAKTADYMFYNTSYTEIPQDRFDLSGIPPNGMSGMFGWCLKLTRVYDYGMPTSNAYSQTFSYCRRLKKIDILRVQKSTSYGLAFQNCDDLEEVTFKGEIGQNISFANSPNLTVETLNHIAEHLYDYSSESSGTKTLTIGSTNIDKLSEEVKIMISAKGWELK